MVIVLEDEILTENVIPEDAPWFGHRGNDERGIQ
jgi:hypothetical protein